MSRWLIHASWPSNYAHTSLKLSAVIGVASAIIGVPQDFCPSGRGVVKLDTKPIGGDPVKLTLRFIIALAFLLATSAFAQTWPTKPVKVVVPYSPGGLPDTVARVVGQALSEKWGQQVIVENKPGG